MHRKVFTRSFVMHSISAVIGSALMGVLIGLWIPVLTPKHVNPSENAYITVRTVVHVPSTSNQLVPKPLPARGAPSCK